MTLLIGTGVPGHQKKKRMHMNRTHALLVAATIFFGGAASAFAGTAHITGGGLDFYMDSQGMPGVNPNTGSNFLSGPELRDLHNSLNAAGISTDGVVTFLLADTGAGLTLYTLVDNNATIGSGAIDAILGMSSTTVASAGYVMNDLGVDLANYSTDGTTQTVSGDYFWHPDGGADGMAWTGLNIGDTGNFDFTAYMGDGETAANNTTFAGLNSSDTFQFISWNGAAWDNVMSGSFDDSGSFSFAFAIVPLPPAVALGLAGIGLVTVARRRRNKKA